MSSELISSQDDLELGGIDKNSVSAT